MSGHVNRNEPKPYATTPKQERNDNDHLVIYAIYECPKDYPGKYVVRGWHIVAGGPVPADKPLAVTDTLAEARAQLPPGLAMLLPTSDDDPVICETWI